MTAIRTTAAVLALALAGVVQASTISIVDMGNVDTTGIGGGVHPEFQVYQFTVKRTTETAKINALEIYVSSPGTEVHQIWGEGVSFGNKTYTASPKYGDIGDPPQSYADSEMDPDGTGLFSLNVVAPAEDMATIVPGNNGTFSYSGPASTIDPELSAAGFQGGFGTSFKFVGAVPGGSELNDYTVYQLVVPDALASYVLITVKATAPGSAINDKQFLLGEIPEPATLSMLGLGTLLLLRRRRRLA